ncbi:hypothetical protein [Arthrobacter sp. ok362]|uniref:hypothetical protein n=1 Tax=Arthrobacter sp. ok362 TaxID=1761745 RepID=UPI000B82DA93|nr:hypothetical protein [Arthrobacter sp. ok362]
MNHKLHVLFRMDVDPVHVKLEISGCVTPSDSAALMHIVRRACRLGAGAEVVIDLHGTSHLDPEVLLGLRRLADAGYLAAPTPSPDAGASEAAEPFRLVLDEPTELPICLLHVGADAEVLAGLDTGLKTGIETGLDAGLGAGLETGLDAGLGAANSPLAAETGSANDFGTIDGLALSDYFEDTLDPVATVRALSDTALCRLADALYRHLDTSSPLFGAHTWYELAAEELQNRHLADGDGPAGDELAPDTALA